MKFKVIICSLLAGILLAVGITGFYLVQEAQKQTEIIQVQARSTTLKNLYEAGGIGQEYHLEMQHACDKILRIATENKLLRYVPTNGG